MRAQISASAPGSPLEGQFYFDSTKKSWGFYTGTVWTYPTESAGVSEATSSTLGTIKTTGDLGGTGGNPTVVHFTLSSNASANGFKITALAEPTLAGDAATKGYVDAKANGIAWKNPVVVATTAALPANTQSGEGPTGKLTTTAVVGEALPEIDGYAPKAGDRILVKNEATEKNNGIYEVTVVGSASEKWVLTRTADANTAAELQDATALVERGTVNEDHVFNLSNKPPLTIDGGSGTALKWVEIQSATSIKGDGKFTQRTGNTLEVLPDAATLSSEPAEGAITAEGEGVTRKKTFRFRGNASLTEFTLKHNLNTRQIAVIGQENEGGNPGAPIELDWVPVNANEVKITFPTAPAKATNYFVACIG